MVAYCQLVSTFHIIFFSLKALKHISRAATGAARCFYLPLIHPFCVMRPHMNHSTQSELSSSVQQRQGIKKKNIEQRENEKVLYTL